ncbi:hypothetical protein ACQ4WP_21575 [Janthinobacterium sp. GB4P2]|uniref:hypothetical protein n=1 Tax=Janthinobacterium sp. GB4P2 TaxID=3424189 RepID=UPI003F1FFCF5
MIQVSTITFWKIMRNYIVGMLVASVSAPILAQNMGDAMQQAEKSNTDAASGTPNTVSSFFGRMLKKDGAASAANGGKRIQDTPIYKIFEKYPVTDSHNPPDYPKTAISISYPNWLNEGDATIGRFKPNQCLTYSVTYWANKDAPQIYDNLVVCASDLSKVSHSSLRTVWPFFGLSGTNTGQVRTTGPIPPATPFPTDAASRTFIERGGVFFLGAIMTAMGYDWNFSADSRRVWVVKVGEPASMADKQNRSTGEQMPSSAQNQAVLSKCRPENFNQDRYNRITVGMTLDAVKQTIGCEPDSDFTQRSAMNVMYKWAVTINNLVAAKSIDVFFDPTGKKVKGLGQQFKFASGF